MQVYLNNTASINEIIGKLPAGLTCVRICECGNAALLQEFLNKLPLSVAHVSLNGNDLYRLGAAGLKKALSGLPEGVTHVDLCGNYLDELGAAGLKKALSVLPTSVTEVNLSYNQLSSVIKEFNGSSSSTKDNIALANIQELTLSISDVDNSDKKCLNYFLSKLFPGLLKLKLIDEDDREVRSVIHEEFLEDFFADRQKLLMDPVHKHINVTDLASILFGYACGPTLSEEINNNPSNEHITDSVKLSDKPSSDRQQSHCGPTLSTDSVKLSDNPSSDRQQSHSRYKFFAVLTLSLFVILTSSVFAGLAVLGRNVGEFFKHFTLDLSHKIMLVLLLTAGASLIESICFVGGARAESKAANSNSGLTPQYRPYN